MTKSAVGNGSWKNTDLLALVEQGRLLIWLITDHVPAGEEREPLRAEVVHRRQLREQSLRVGAHQAQSRVE